MRNPALLLILSVFPVLAQDSSGNAVVLNASLTGKAGDVIYLQGSGFGSNPNIQYSFNDGNWVSLAPLTSSNEAATVMLPANLSQLPDLVSIRIAPDCTHWSTTPVYLNQARAYSFDTNQIASGDTFRIFGRNLYFSRTPSVRLVDITSGVTNAPSLAAAVNLANSTAYALVVAAPAGIAAKHTYAVYVSNGYNGNASSGGETLARATLQGRTPGLDYWNLNVPWAADLNFYNNVYNVKTDPRLVQHAYGAGGAGDRGAIGGAIAAANQAGGGIVYLPAGTYNLYYSNGCGISMLPRVVLMGAGEGATIINYGFGPAPGIGTGYAICFATSQTGVSDLTVNNVNQAGNWPESAIGANANELFIQRTSWSLANAQWLALPNTTNATIQNSNIVQALDPSFNGPLNAQNSTNFVLRSSLIKYVAGAIEFDGVNTAVLENNFFIRDASQSVPAGGITHVVVGSFTQNFMVLNNSFLVSGGTLPRSNDGESINSEAGGAVRRDEFRGNVSAGNSNAITDNSQNFNYSTNNAIPNLHVGAILAIVAGPGAGEWGTVSVVAANGHTVYVTGLWPVVPTAASRYATFDWSASNWIIAGNTMSDNEKGIEFGNSSINDILITGNQLTNNGEILITPTEQPTGAGMFNLVLNTEITNNVLADTENLRPAAISVVPREDLEANNFGTSVIGLQLRNNSISGHIPPTIMTQTSLDDSKALTEGLNVYWQWQTVGVPFADDGTPSILGTVIQGNKMINSSAAYELNSGDYQTVLDANTLSSVTTAVSDTTVYGAGHASVGTVTASPNSTSLSNACSETEVSTTPVYAWNQVSVGSLAANKLTPQVDGTTSFRLLPSLWQFSTGGDAFSMLAEQLSADTQVSAKITIPPGFDWTSQGSVVFRESESPTSPFVSAGVRETGEFLMTWRSTAGGMVSSWQLAMGTPGSPLWVRLVKSGNDFKSYYSSNGINWGFGYDVTSAFNTSSYLVGLESFSDTLAAPAMQFDSVSAP